jgi:hypothetical protein
MSALCRLSIRVPPSGEVVHHHPFAIPCATSCATSFALDLASKQFNAPSHGRASFKATEVGWAAGGSGCQRLGG